MSILSSLFHNEIHDKPNEVHNNPKGVLPAQDSADEHLTHSAKQRLDSIKKCNVKPALFYSEDEAQRGARGIEQDAHTVASHLEQREETPRG